MSSAGARKFPAALLMSWLAGPSSLSAASNAAFTEAGSRTSAGTPIAVPPAARMAPTVSLRGSGRRPRTATRAPRPARRKAAKRLASGRFGGQTPVRQERLRRCPMIALQLQDRALHRAPRAASGLERPQQAGQLRGAPRQSGHERDHTVGGPPLQLDSDPPPRRGGPRTLGLRLPLSPGGVGEPALGLTRHGPL